MVQPHSDDSILSNEVLGSSRSSLNQNISSLEDRQQRCCQLTVAGKRSRSRSVAIGSLSLRAAEGFEKSRAGRF